MTAPCINEGRGTLSISLESLLKYVVPSWLDAVALPEQAESMREFFLLSKNGKTDPFGKVFMTAKLSHRAVVNDTLKVIGLTKVQSVLDMVHSAGYNPGLWDSKRNVARRLAISVIGLCVENMALTTAKKNRTDKLQDAILVNIDLVELNSISRELSDINYLFTSLQEKTL